MDKNNNQEQNKPDENKSEKNQPDNSSLAKYDPSKNLPNNSQNINESQISYPHHPIDAEIIIHGEDKVNRQKKSKMWLMILTRTGIGLGVILILGMIGGGWWLTKFVDKDLSPLVEKNLTNLLDRPVKLGKVEKFSFNSLKFGISSIPTTNTDQGNGYTQGVDVSFDPIEVLTKRTLNLDIKLIKPSLYLVQNDQGKWINTKLKMQPKDTFITTKVKSIKVQGANVVLVPNLTHNPLLSPDEQNGDSSDVKNKTLLPNQNQVILTEVDVKADILEQNELVKFQLLGTPKLGGNFKISGDYFPKKDGADIKINVEQFAAINITRLINLPINLQGGIVKTADLQVKIVKDQKVGLIGKADVEQVSLKVKGLPKILEQSTGKLEFKTYIIELKDVTTFFGQIPLKVAGSIDRNSGYNIEVKSPPVSLKNAIQTLNLKLPVYFPIVDQLGNLNNLGFSTPDLSFLNPENKTSESQKKSPEEDIKTDDKKVNKTEEKSTENNDTDSDVRVEKKSTAKTEEKSTENNDTDSDVRVEKKSTAGNKENDDTDSDVRVEKKSTAKTEDKKVNKTEEKSTENNDTDSDVRVEKKSTAKNQGKTEDKQKIKTEENNEENATEESPTKTNIKLPLVGEIITEIKITGEINQPILTGKITSRKGIILDKISLGVVSSNFELIGDNLKITDIKAIANIGGDIRGAGAAKIGKNGGILINLFSNNLPGDALARLYGFNLPITIGRMAGAGQISGQWDNLKTLIKWNAPRATYPSQGELTIFPNGETIINSSQIQAFGGSVNAKAKIVDGKWIAAGDFKIPLNSLLGNKINVSQRKQLSAPILGQFQATGNMSNSPFENIVGLGSGNIDLGGGKITAKNVKIENGRWQANIDASGVKLGDLLPLPPLLKGRFFGNLNLSGPVKEAGLKNVSGTIQGTVAIIGGGEIKVDNLRIENGQWNGQIKAQGIQLDKIAPVALRGKVGGTFDLSGSLDSVKLQTILGKGSGILELNEGGKIIANNIELKEGKWQAKLAVDQLGLQPFSREMRGNLTGVLMSSGSLTNFNLPGVKFGGNVTLSQGISAIKNPINAAVSWDGKQLAIQQATSNDGFLAMGGVGVNINNNNQPQITDIQLNVKAKNLSLSTLPVKLPKNVNLNGNVDFTGNISGNFNQINISGNIEKLSNLMVNKLAFEPNLRGTINLQQGRGTNLELRGKKDKIAVSLSGNNRPVSFFLKPAIL